MRITLYELFQLCDIESTDIGDDVYDWCENFSCYTDKSKCKEYYDKLMRFFAIKIECDRYRPNWYSNCFVSNFIRENIEVFTKFLNEENIEGHRPMDYANEPMDDELFYDLYMGSMRFLIAGEYSEKQYEKLFKMFGGK